MKLLNGSVSTVDDWFRISPPKRGIKQWRDGRSAKELARYLTASLPNMPKEVESVLANFTSRDSTFSWEAEYVTDFASYGLGKGEGRNHDALLFSDELVVGIEAKADESLDEYIGTKLIGAGDNKKLRVNGLIDMLFGDSADKHADLRYQLVTATCGTLLEAKKRNLNKALVLVIVFKKQGCYSEDKVLQNERDIAVFLEHCHAVQADSYYVVPTEFGKEHAIDLYFANITIDLT